MVEDQGNGDFVKVEFNVVECIIDTARGCEGSNTCKSEQETTHLSILFFDH